MASASVSFLAGHAGGDHWRDAAAAILKSLGPVEPRHRLGVLYTSYHFAGELDEITVFLRQTTGVPRWIGCAGAGIVAGTGDSAARDYFEEAGLALLIMDVPEDGFRIFTDVSSDTDPITAMETVWLGEVGPPLVVAHADPGNELLISLIEDVAEETDGFMVGGLGLFPGQPGQIADTPTAAGLSGAMFSMTRVPVQTGLTQGCSPIGPIRQVGACEGGTISVIDDRPALDVFKEDIGELLARDLERCGGYIFAGLPVPGSDTRDYLVRNLVSLDTVDDQVEIAAHVRPGDRILFCRRDAAAAVEDMRAMLMDLKRRVGDRPIRGGLYFSCVARGPSQFNEPEREHQLIEEALGRFPLVGFFGNGEISHNRLYGYTGVLTLFL